MAGVPCQRLTQVQLVELAARHGLVVDADAVRINEQGLDYRVAFVRTPPMGRTRCFRVPRTRDAAAKLSGRGANPGIRSAPALGGGADLAGVQR